MAENYYTAPPIDDYTKQQYMDKVTNDLKIAIANFELTNKSVTAEKLAEGSVEDVHIKEATIGSVHISEGAISNAHIGRGVIETAHIGNAQIEGGHIKNATLEGINIKSGTIENVNIKDTTISGAKIALATIDNANIKDLTIDGSAKIKLASIDGANIKLATIDNANIKQGTITSAAIKAGAIETASIKDAAITNALIADLAVDSAKIKEIIADKIISGTLNTSAVTVAGVGGHLRIAGNRLQVFDNGETPIERVALGDVDNNGTLYGLRVRGEDGTTVLYDHNGVYEQGITDGAITNPKIGDDAVDSRILKVDSVLAEHILAGEITTDKIATRTILATNIAANTLTANEMVTNLITANSALIAEAAITNANIANGAITNAKIQDATIESAKIKTLSADKITAGTVNADLVTISNGKVTINSEGVAVKDAGFFVEDSISGTKQNITPQTNLIVDHSFEMLQAGTHASGIYSEIANYDLYDAWYRWAQTGSPKIALVMDGKSAAPYGAQAVSVNGSNFLFQYFRFELGKPYTVSFANQYTSYGTNGKPRVTIQWMYQDDYGQDVVYTQQYKDFNTPANDGTFVRNAFTVTSPSSMPTASYWAKVIITSDGINWAEFDGVQVVQSIAPAIYQPEDEVWRMRRGTDKYESQIAKQTLSVESITATEESVFSRGTYTDPHPNTGYAVKVSGGIATDSIRAYGGGKLSSLEVGGGLFGSSASPGFVDFHSSGAQGANDYDARIISWGGNKTSTGKGLLEVIADDVKFLVPANHRVFQADTDGWVNHEFWDDHTNVIHRFGQAAMFKWQRGMNRFEARTGDDSGWKDITGGSIYSSSSKKWKTNIKDYDKKALDVIGQANVKSYNRTDDPEVNNTKLKIGLIAEEAPTEVLSPGGDAVDLYALGTLAWKAIQELKAEIDLLKAKK